MTLTLLLDLDDTLLVNPLEQFMPRYIELLSEKLSPLIPRERMVPQLMTATDRMIENQNPCKILKDVFDRNFYPLLGLDQTKTDAVIDEFYENEFNQLKKVTRVRPGAEKLIDFCTSKNYRMIVATNPLFPQTAMRSRLNWAGFDGHNFPFVFVTSYECMHFAKPNPAYYAEILAKFGWQNAPVCMVGNSLRDDILPAQALGLPCFWVDGDPSRLPGGEGCDCAVGRLEEVIPWLEKIANRSSSVAMKDSNAILAVLKSTPAVLQSFTDSLAEMDWHAKPLNTDLNILELISHWLDVEKEINHPRIQLVLSNDNPFIAGIDSDAWVVERNYNQTRSPRVLEDFISERMKSIEILTSLSQEDWRRTARHSFFGPTSLLELVKFIAVHDMDHIRQIFRLVNAKKYNSA